MAAARNDIVLFGATGFVGRRAAAYLARRCADHRLRLAVAGRDPQRLRALAGGLAGEPAVLVADGRDPSACRAMAAAARVVASTAGPFARYSDAVVEACVAEGAHYVDITGETPWVRTLIDRHHAAARAKGLRIVPCCGFDSVPGDLGSLLAVEHLRRAHGVGCRSIRAWYALRGGFNGGTAASALLILEDLDSFFDGTLLEPPEERGSAPSVSTRYGGARFDPEQNRWTAPFLMAPINVAVVRRSAGLARERGTPYGDDFTYEERMAVSTRRKAVTLATVLRGMAAAAALPGGRRLLGRLAPPPGTGPSEEEIAGGFFRCELLGEGEAEGSGRGPRVRVVIAGDGDAGNHATALFLSEAALTLAEDAAIRPGGAEGGGVLTPATAFGARWADALRAAGFRIDVEGAPL